MKANKLSDVKRRRIVQMVYDGGADAEQLAKSMKVSLERLAEWALDDRMQSTLRGLRTLADMQTQMILSRYRLTAAARLVKMAGQEEGSELSRKACVDLLRMNLLDDCPAADDDLPPMTPVSEQKVLEALRKLGEDE